MKLFARRFLPHIIVATMVVLAMVVTSLALTINASGSSSPNHTAIVFRYANEGTSDLLTLDPATGPDLNELQAVQLIFGGLVRFGASHRVLPDAAKSWKITDGGRTYVFTIRPNMRFGDGSRLTAQDVAFSLNRTLSPPFAQQSGAFILKTIRGAAKVSTGLAREASGIQVVSKQRLRIHLTAPSGSFLAKLATPAGYIVSQLAVTRDPKHWYRHAFGTGSFMVQRWVPNSGLFLVPNPFYWQGKPRIDGIDMPFIPEPLAAYKRYRAGNLDTMGNVQFPGELLYDVQGAPDFHQSANLETVYLTLNEQFSPFSLPLVREAFAHAVNRKQLARDVFGNFARPTTGMLPPGLPGYSPSVKGEQYNPALAQRLLARAGFPQGRGFPAVNYASDQDVQSLDLAESLAAQWEKVLGVRVLVRQYFHSGYLKALDQHNYQIAVIDWTADYPDAENFLTQQLRTGSPNNNGGWSNQEFDRLVDRAGVLPLDSAKRLALYAEAERIAMGQAATIPLVNPTKGILLRKGVEGLIVSGGELLAPSWSKVTISRGTNQ